jgi:hypothetical protein
MLDIRALATDELLRSDERRARVCDLIETLPHDTLEWELLYQCISTLRMAIRFPGAGFGTGEAALTTLNKTLGWLMSPRGRSE